MSELLQRDLTKAEVYGKEMARLHLEMHKIEADTLPDYKNKHQKFIQSVSKTLGKRTNDILILLDEIEVENKICHGDLHLGNVMAYKDNYKVIDWMNVTSSSPMADVYRTVLMLESPVSYHTVPKEIRHLVKEVLNRVKESYLDYYFTNSEEGIESMRQWIPIVAASRLSEEVPFEKEWLISLIDKNLSC